jgi:hypothetical protein
MLACLRYNRERRQWLAKAPSVEDSAKWMDVRHIRRRLQYIRIELSHALKNLHQHCTQAHNDRFLLKAPVLGIFTTLN